MRVLVVGLGAFALSAAATASQSAADCSCRIVPALLPLTVEIMAPVSSKTSKTGEMFPIRLAEPITLDGVTVVPAGAMGVGEVVHAKKSGGSGAGGELILAARYLDVSGRRMALRSMQLAATGQDQTVLAMAASELIGPFGFAVRGKNVEIAAGRRATAKTAVTFMLPAETAAAQTTPSTTGESK